MKKDELSALAPSLQTDQYHDAWSLLCILWRGLWHASATDWGRYRLRIWSMFSGWVASSVRMGRGLDGFLDQFSKRATLTQLGSNDRERQEILRILSLPQDQQNHIAHQLRNNLPVLIMLLRLYRDALKQMED
jgi:hypothetical protein